MVSLGQKEQKQAEYILQTINVSKSYHSPEGSLPILKEVDLQVRQGEFVTIMGHLAQEKRHY